MPPVRRHEPCRSFQLTAATCAVALAATLGLARSGAGTNAAAAAPAVQVCAATTDHQAGPITATPCWVDVSPYPFGSDGDPVDTSGERCRLLPPECFLTATSLAFRAWN